MPVNYYNKCNNVNYYNKCDNEKGHIIPLTNYVISQKIHNGSYFLFYKNWIIDSIGVLIIKIMYHRRGVLIHTPNFASFKNCYEYVHPPFSKDVKETSTPRVCPTDPSGPICADAVLCIRVAHRIHHGLHALLLRYFRLFELMDLYL